MWGLDHKEGWLPKNWCFITAVLEKIIESPLERKEIKLVDTKWDQSWIFNGRTDAEVKTPILWPPDMTNRLIGKEPDAGKDWRQVEKGTTEDEMVGWHHGLSGMSLSKIREIVKDREAWHVAVYGVTKNRIQLSNWTITTYTDTNIIKQKRSIFNNSIINNTVFIDVMKNCVVSIQKN